MSFSALLAKLKTTGVVRSERYVARPEIGFGTGLVFSNRPNSGRITKKERK